MLEALPKMVSATECSSAHTCNDFETFVPCLSDVNKYGRHKNEHGRWVSNNPNAAINLKKFGEGKGHYVVGEKGNLSNERRPEAGHYLDRLHAEEITITGGGGASEHISPLETFEEMNLNQRLMQNIRKKGYVKPLPIQRATFPLIQAGYDIIGHAITGGGKTAAFLIPIIDYISKEKENAGIKRNKHPYCIVISPTKELAEQLYEDTRTFAAGLNCDAILSFGEIPRQENIAKIEKGCDILLCTVGRLCDYLVDEILKLDQLHFLVFDEADGLLRVHGFYNDLVDNLLPKCREIPKLQNLLFSATDCADLAGLKGQFLRPNAVEVVVGCRNSVNPLIIQQVLKVEVHERREALLQLMQALYINDEDLPPPKTIVYVNTKRSATVIACYLSLKGYKAYPIQGNLTAMLRREAIEALQSGDCHVLVSTDVTSRGLDIKNISHIINYEMPKIENWVSYVHRVGRTGRVGNVGCATTFFDPFVDGGMALTLYGWLAMNHQTIPDFLEELAKQQAECDDLDKKAEEEYQRAMNESHMENSDDDEDQDC